MPIRRNQDVVFDSHAADVVVVLEKFTVDELSVCGVAEEVTLDKGPAEVTEKCVSACVSQTVDSRQKTRITYIPGSTVTIMFGRRACRPL